MHIIVLIIAFLVSVSAFDENAGLIPSYTSKATATATSVLNTVNVPKNVLDDNISTEWESGSCLPSGFVVRTDINPLLNLCAESQCSSPDKSANLTTITDGNVAYTSTTINVVDGVASFEVTLKAPTMVHDFALRGTFNGDATAYAIMEDGTNTLLKTYTSAESYKFIMITPMLSNVKGFVVNSTGKLGLNQVSVTNQQCYEQITVDLGKSMDIGWLSLRVFSGASSINVLAGSSVDDLSVILPLKPNTQPKVDYILGKTVNAQIIAIKQIVEKPYEKVVVQVINAYDKYGPYGAPRKPVFNPNNFHTLAGINGIWGWGTGYDSSNLKNDSMGPLLYAPVAPSARNYHNLLWDVKTPNHIPNYKNMSEGHGTESLSWLNWDTEYGAWNAAGISVEASIQFANSGATAVDKWTDAYQDAYNYGKAYSEWFGPNASEKGRGLVKTLEVGNEPWKYPADFYTKILSGMAKGAKDADSDFQVFPCALQATFPDPDPLTGGNYVGGRITEVNAPYIDGLNIHAYSAYRNGTNVLVATMPEDPLSDFNAIRNMLTYRDVNFPGKPVYLTEWGYDSDGVGEYCVPDRYHDSCVSELASSVYGLRGLFKAAREGIDKAFWFFYANSKGCSTLFCRSGVTGSPKVNYKKKMVYYNFKALLGLVGDMHFLDVVKQDEDAYIYLLGDAQQKPTFIVAWLPIDGNSATQQKVQVTIPNINAQETFAWKFLGTEAGVEKVTNLFTANGNSWTITVNASPILINVA